MKTASHWQTALACALFSAPAFAGNGKLLATSGVTQIEGAGGGGIVPWAVLTGYGSQDEIGVTAYSSTVDVVDYRLQSIGVGAGFYDRVEVSFAQQTFDLTSSGGEIRQNIVGVKARVYGDAIYSRWPQLSVGLQYKDLVDENIAEAVGAHGTDHGTDFYVTGTKVFLGALFGQNALANVTLRATKANQTGLLGYGGDDNNNYEMQAETSLAALIGRRVAVGIEYRQKPDNLSYAKEDDWKDFFVAFVPDKHFSITAAWVDLGSIAGADNQHGFYLSLTGLLQ